jgi:putative endonuclease
VTLSVRDHGERTSVTPLFHCVTAVTSLTECTAYPRLKAGMFSGRLTHATLRAFDVLAAHVIPANKIARHLRTGKRGEEDAYFYLRRLGYVMVARNFRSPRRRGEIDLIGWHKDVLCFIEVKTRTTLDVKPAEAAVDRDKWRQLSAVAREYMRPFPSTLQWRFDVVTVYYDKRSTPPEFQLFQNALPAS